MPNQGASYVLPDGQVFSDNALSGYDPGLADVAQVQAEVQAYPKVGSALGRVGANALNSIWDFAKASVAGSEEAAANQLSRPFAEKLALGENIALSFGPQTFTGYHGTPYLFDKFSDKAIGSGEGAQAYGYGHYVAGNPKTAEMYKEAVTLAATGNNILSVITKKHPDLFSRIEAETGGNPWDSWAPRRKLEQLWDAHNYGDPAKIPNLFSPELTRDLIGSGALTSPPGHLLEINVKPDEHELLDWDKPASEWSDSTVQKIADLATKHKVSMGNATGARAYGDLVKALGGAEAASKALHKAGIPGIKYLDQGSRRAGEGTRNYVIFDPKNLEIRARNGVPLVPVDHDPFQLTPVDHDPFEK